MYDIALFLHSYNRWLVLFFMVAAVGHAWWRMYRQTEWTERDALPGTGFRMTANLQFLLGLALYLLPQGLARGAWRDLGAAMEVEELRFFGFEHPLAMFIAIGLINTGWQRSKEADSQKGKRRWAAGAYTIAALIILMMIPWWRPIARSLNLDSESDSRITDISQLEGEGDADNGKNIFRESIDGQPSCETCHTTDNSRRVGPGLGNIGTTAGERVSGQSAEQYLLSSIVEPGKYVVDGYSNIMPTKFGDVLSDQQLLDLIAYLLTLRE
ncbi:MAG: cytochrome c [Chloroflexi bacterium]|nr:cytochrome c [Chloroflexota bacterium]